MEKRKILVTGAGGFIGFQLSKYLSAYGYDVTGIDIAFPPNGGPLNSGPDSFRKKVIDFRDQEKLQPLLEGIDTVFHLASAHLNINLKKSEYWDINVHSLPLFIKCLHAAGIKKLVHVSSVGVYGNLTEMPANEETICKPQSIYGETKLAGEKIVSKTCSELGLQFVILRPAWVYGATCPRTRKLLKMLSKKRFIMIGDGNNLRHPLYIEDLLSLFKKLIEKDSLSGETFLIGGEQSLTIRELIETICQVFDLDQPAFHLPQALARIIATITEGFFKLIGRQAPLSRRSLEFFDTNNAFDISKAKSRLNYRPAYSFREGLQDIKSKLDQNNMRIT